MLSDGRRPARSEKPRHTATPRRTREARHEVGLPAAPAIGLEPITVRLTVGCSAIELRGNGAWREVNFSNRSSPTSNR